MDLDTLRQREAALLNAMKGATLDQQTALMAELSEVRSVRASLVRSASEVDLANAVVLDHLTPVTAHTSRATAASDWLSEVHVGTGGEYSDEMSVEGTLWFQRLDPAVLANADEFRVQAAGMARVLSGSYGLDAPKAEHAFVAHVAHLRRTAGYEDDRDFIEEQANEHYQRREQESEVGGIFHPEDKGTGSGLDPVDVEDADDEWPDEQGQKQSVVAAVHRQLIAMGVTEAIAHQLRTTATYEDGYAVGYGNAHGQAIVTTASSSEPAWQLGWAEGYIVGQRELGHPFGERGRTAGKKYRCPECEDIFDSPTHPDNGCSASGKNVELEPVEGRRHALTLGELDERPYEATCPNESCSEHGTSFVHDDFSSDNDGDGEVAECPECNTPLVWDSRTARRRTADATPLTGYCPKCSSEDLTEVEGGEGADLRCEECGWQGDATEANPSNQTKESTRKLAGDQVEMATIPPCDIDASHGPAAYDARLPGLGGGWGYACESCFRSYGPGRTGTGFAQRLVQASRRTATEEGGETCGECGAKIERDPAGEEPRTWHHADGSSHDHEAKPKSKESRRTADVSQSRWVYVDERGVESGWFTDEEKAEMEGTRQPGANFTWRELSPEEVASFTQWAGDLAYQQASRRPSRIASHFVFEAGSDDENADDSSEDDDDRPQWLKDKIESEGGRRTAVTYYPDNDWGGMVLEDEKSGIGTHAEGYSVLEVSISWEAAQEKYPGIKKADHAVPVTVDKSALRTAAKSTNCTNGNHSSCGGGSCSCTCHDSGRKANQSGACGDGDHDDCKMSHGTGPDDCGCPVCRKKSTSSRKVSVSLTNVGIDHATGNGTGTDPQGNKVQFRLTDKEREDLKFVLLGDLAVNFSGVSVDESDIIREGSRHIAAAQEFSGPTIEAVVAAVQATIPVGGGPKLAVANVNGVRTVIEVMPAAFGPVYTDHGSYESFYATAVVRVAGGGTISDPQHSFTKNPDDENWIGNFTDEAIEENIRFWSSEEGKNAQPYLPGYDTETLKLFQDELARRRGTTAMKRMANLLDSAKQVMETKGFVTVNDAGEIIETPNSVYGDPGEAGESDPANQPEEEGVILDMQTANLIVTLVPELNQENQQKILSMPVTQAVDVLWKLYGKVKASRVNEKVGEILATVVDPWQRELDEGHTADPAAADIDVDVQTREEDASDWPEVQGDKDTDKIAGLIANPERARAFRERVARGRRPFAHEAMPNPVDLGIKVGDIFNSSWGYDQTNVSFYEVTGLTGASVRIRKVRQSATPDSVGNERVVPVPGEYIGEEMTKRLLDSGSSKPAIKINTSEYAWLWDGKPEYQTGPYNMH